MDDKEKVINFFQSLLLYLKDAKEIETVPEEVVNEYNENVEKLKTLLNTDLDYLKMKKEDLIETIYISNGSNYLRTKIGYITDTSSTTRFTPLDEFKNYKKSNLIIKVYQVILLLKNK